MEETDVNSREFTRTTSVREIFPGAWALVEGFLRDLLELRMIPAHFERDGLITRNLCLILLQHYTQRALRARYLVVNNVLNKLLKILLYVKSFYVYV